MIYLCPAFPKSGSTLLFTCVEQLVVQSGKKNAQKTFTQKFTNGYIPTIGFGQAMYLCWLSIFKGSIVVKTHDRPRFFTRLLLSTGMAKACYVYRDPRDVVISALDHATQARNRTQALLSDKAFSGFYTYADVVPHIQKQYAYFQQWKKVKKLLMFTYEQVVQDQEKIMLRLVREWKMPVSDTGINTIAEKIKNNPEGIRHYNTGKLTRYDHELSPQQIKELENLLGPCISGMGFKPVT